MFGLPISSMPLVWLGVMIFFAVAEGITVGLTSIWFSVGALVALLVSLVCPNFWVQAGVFVLVSLGSLLLVGPLAKRHFRPKDHTPTNVDSLLGHEGVVLETIDNLAGTGQVKIAGQTWTARSASGAVIPQGATVTAMRIEGVRLFVLPVEPI